MRGLRNVPKNRRRGRSRKPRPPVKWLAIVGVGLGLWWLSGVRTADDTIRASVTLPELGSTWDRIFDPLRELFVLERVDFLGLEALDASVLARTLDLPRLPLIDVDPTQACTALLSALPRIEDCDALRLPPNRLLVSVSERRPIARLSGGTTGVDSHGTEFALAPTEAESLPELSGDVEAALTALRAAREREVEVLGVHAERADQIALDLPGARRVLVGSDPERSFERWERLQAARVLEEETGLEIDTRFRGQVVVRPRTAQTALRGTLRDERGASGGAERQAPRNDRTPRSDRTPDNDRTPRNEDGGE